MLKSLLDEILILPIPILRQMFLSLAALTKLLSPPPQMPRIGNSTIYNIFFEVTKQQALIYFLPFSSFQKWIQGPALPTSLGHQPVVINGKGALKQ